MNKNMKALISLAIIVVLIGLNFMVVFMVEKNPSLKFNLSSSKVSLTAETTDYLKTIDKPVTLKIISVAQYVGDPVIQQFNQIAKKLASANKNFIFEEIAFDQQKEDSVQAIEKYINIAQERQEELSPLTIIIEEGENIALATPAMNEEEMDYFSAFEGTFVNKLQGILDPSASEITIPRNDLNIKEPEPFEIGNKTLTTLIILYLIIIPAICFGLAAFLLRKKRAA